MHACMHTNPLSHTQTHTCVAGAHQYLRPCPATRDLKLGGIIADIQPRHLGPHAGAVHVRMHAAAAVTRLRRFEEAWWLETTRLLGPVPPVRVAHLAYHAHDLADAHARCGEGDRVWRRHQPFTPRAVAL
jgi:hypothetical protein